MSFTLLKENETTQKIIDLLEAKQSPFKLIEHEKCRTSEESARARVDGGGTLVVGAKALLIKATYKDGSSDFILCVLSGHQKICSKSLKTELNIKKFRFSTSEEMLEVTDGLEPGTVPPFGSPILPKINHVFVDESLLEHDSVGFNAACFTRSIILATSDYLKAANPEKVFDFSTEK